MAAKVKAKPKKRPAAEAPAGVSSVLTRADICAALRVSLRTLTAMRRRGEYPEPDMAINRKLPRWSLALHERWFRDSLAARAAAKGRADA